MVIYIYIYIEIVSNVFLVQKKDKQWFLMRKHALNRIGYEFFVPMFIFEISISQSSNRFLKLDHEFDY